MRGASRGDRRTIGAERADTPEGVPPPRVVVSGDETGGRFALVETLERRSAEPPLHLHTREDEFVYVLAGCVTFCRADRDLRRGPGDGVLLPRGCEHTYRVESGEARLLVLLVPAGLEGLYRELAVPTNGRHGPGAVDGRQDFERLVTVAARYGVAITGPPPGD